MSGNEQVVKLIIDLANLHDADGMLGHIADHIEYADPISGPTDKSGMHAFHEAIFAAFPDLNFAVTRWIPASGTVALECTMDGTHTNEFKGTPATNAHLMLPAVIVADVEDGRVVRWQSYFDVHDMRRQLGV